MSWLVASAQLTELATIRDGNPALWRELRRFNAPIQLAVAAAREVATRAIAPTEAALVSLAPCQSGSPELHRWVRDIEATGAVRVNPTHTLHAVDNLALSVLAIALANQAWAMSLGGAPGMLWTALELAGERLAEDREVIVLGGDQASGYEISPAAGFALLFAREPMPYARSGRPTRLVAIERRPPGGLDPVAHAAAGALAMLAALHAAPAGRFAYAVPAADGDGADELLAIWELG